jgi:uncharacterized protein (DUF488 family)
MPAIATIGVYGFTAETFRAALDAADVRLLLDVRQRRGVRGPQYAWANSQRLQAMLRDAGIGYHHHPELAPATELRRLQYAADAREGVGKRSRMHISPAFRDGYLAERLDRVDLAELVAELPAKGIATLMCVERDAEACHRSLIAQRLTREHGLTVVDLRPA